jgi:hypothetical protein
MMNSALNAIAAAPTDQPITFSETWSSGGTC